MDFNKYKGKDILAWLSYNPNYESTNDAINRVCYVYPRILVKGVKESECEPIDYATDFPKYGSIEVRIYGGISAEEVSSNLGSLVNIRINAIPSPNYERNNVYTLRYNYQLGKTTSEIWLESFSGKGFYQVIDVNSDIQHLQNDRSIPEPDCTVRTTLILLRCGAKLYGPFEYDIKEGTLSLLGIQENQYCIGEYDALSCNDYLLPIYDNEGEEALALIPKSCIPKPQKCNVRYDWISERTLIDNFTEFLRTENSLTRDQARQLKDAVQRLAGSSATAQFTESRRAKIQSLLEDIVQNEEYTSSIVQYALKDDHIKQLLAEEVANNFFDLVQDRLPEITSAKRRITELSEQEAALKQDFSNLKAAYESEKGKKSEEDIRQLAKLTQEVENLKAENQELRKKDELCKEIDALKEERNRLKAERDSAKASYDQQLLDNDHLAQQFESTLEAFNDKATQTARILDSKLLDKILRGLGDEPPVEKIASFDSSLLHTAPMDCSDIIHRVMDFVCNKAHRDVSFNDVTNYLICITQGFITTFAGEPGTGKTSLCNILAKALGLAAPAPNNRFVDISVERGWSSHKDFIGYYNPLSKKVERSNGEVFDAFELMDRECTCNAAEIAPFFILLDEANLSPIEHYWAAFLRNCDFTSVSDRSISLGGSKNFKLPEHLRFLATVNFDHTTEELSPRFLDRSWVIMLEPARIDDEIDEDFKNSDDMISFGTLKSAFSIQNNDVIDDAIQNKWNDIQKIFRDRSLQIMPRNLKMVRNYCAVGCRCMERDTPATKFAPLDYAISQKILPTINGNGENYRLLIEDLLKECTAQNMPITAKHLERMKRIAENNMGFYQFFSH